MNNDEVMGLLRKVKSFPLFSDQDLLGLSQVSQLKELEIGEVIIQQGEYDGCIYILLKGNLEISKDGKRIGTMNHSGEIFGEMSIVDGSPRSATIKATEETVVLSIDAAIMDRNLNPDDVHRCYVVYRLFAEALAERLRETTAENIKLKKIVSLFGNPVTDVHDV